MNRKQFIGQLWQKYFYPVIFVWLGFYCIKFLFAVFTEDGNERSSAIAFLWITVIALVISVLQNIVIKAIRFIPEKVKAVFNKVMLIAFGALIYHTWSLSKAYAIVLSLILLIQIMSEERKQKTFSATK